MATPEFLGFSTAKNLRNKSYQVHFVHACHTYVWFAAQVLGNWPHRDQSPLPYYFFLLKHYKPKAIYMKF